MAFLIAYYLDNRIFGPRVGGVLGNYVLPTLLWGLITAYCFFLPGVRTLGRLRLGRLLRWLALMCVFIGALAIMLEGAMGGFGKSPYDHSVLGILINIISLGIPLIGIEMARSWLLNRHFSKHPIIGIALLSTMFTLLSLPINKLLNLAWGLPLIKFLGMQFAPTLGENVLASYLVLLGGAWPAVIYRGGLLALEYLSPILPTSNWVNQTLLGTLAPILGLIVVRHIYKEEARTVRAYRQEEGQWGWIFTSLASIIILWFTMGVFTYVPKVILTGSMEPIIKPGDIVIVHKVSPKTTEDIKLGDIIMFPMDGVKVTHRVVAVQDYNGLRIFTTKGDANDSPEAKALPETSVQGKVVMIVPKLGKLALLLRSG